MVRVDNIRWSYHFRRNTFVGLHPGSTHITGWDIVRCQGTQGISDSCELVVFRNLLPSQDRMYDRDVLEEFVKKKPI